MGKKTKHFVCSFCKMCRNDVSEYHQSRQCGYKSEQLAHYNHSKEIVSLDSFKCGNLRNTIAMRLQCDAKQNNNNIKNHAKPF